MLRDVGDVFAGHTDGVFANARLGLPIRVEKELSIRCYLISSVISHLCVPLVVREFEMLSLLVERSNAKIMGSGRCRLDALNLFGRFH